LMYKSSPKEVTGGFYARIIDRRGNRLRIERSWQFHRIQQQIRQCAR